MRGNHALNRVTGTHMPNASPETMQKETKQNRRHIVAIGMGAWTTQCNQGLPLASKFATSAF